MTATSNQNMFSALQVDEDVQSQSEVEKTVPVLKRQDAKGSLSFEAAAVEPEEPEEEEEDEESMIIDLGVDNFPLLGSKDTSKGVQQRTDSPVPAGKVSGAPLPKKFTVASSRIAELRGQHERPKYERRERAERSEFDPATLTCTKPCQFVVRKEDGKFGVCYRETCTFAHSHAELKLPQCAFGDRCNKRDGTYDPKTRKTDKSRKCQFFHPDETVDGFYGRTKRDKPDLPATSKDTRKPKKARQSKKEMKKEQEQAIEEIAEAMGEVKIAKRPTPPETAPAKAEEEVTIIRVPKEMAGMAMDAAISRGLTNFKIVTYVDV